MDVSFTNVLERAREYFRGLPVPSTSATPSSSSENRLYDDPSHQSNQNPSNDSHSESRYNDCTKLDENRDTQLNESYWSTSGELRTIEPYPPQPTRVEVPDTRPDEGGERTASPPTSLTEMQPPNRPQSTSQRHPSEGPLDPPKSHSPPPVYQQLNSVSRPSSYRSTTEMLNSNSHSAYQPADRPPSAPIAQRTQYYPRYHHPDITKSAPAPFSQNSIYQAPTPANNLTPSAAQPSTRTTPTDQENPLRNTQHLDQSPYPLHSSNPSIYQTGNYRTNSNNPDPLHSSSSTSSNSNPCSPRHAQTSHIPSPHSHPGHIPSPHLPVPSVIPPSSSSSHSLPQNHQHTSRLTPTLQNPYTNRVTTIPYSSANQNQQMLPPPSPSNYPLPHDSSSHHGSPQRQSPHMAVHNPHAMSPHQTSSPHNPNFQPHSPTYPPPPLPPRPSNTYSLSTSQQHRPTYQSGYPQSSYHSYQKQSGYPQTSRPYTQLPVSGPSPTQSPTLNPLPASPDVNGSYLNSPAKLTYNGIEPKHSIPTVSQGNSYRMPVSSSRNANTHNLPITAVSSYHSNRNSRDAVGKVQTLPRQRAPNSISVPAPPAPRGQEYNPMTRAVNERLPVATSASPNYPYTGQRNYRGYGTTVAPSHHGSSSNTTVTSIVNDTRPAQPVTVHTRPSSDTRSAPHQRMENYSYKDYTYANSVSQAVTRVSSPPPTQVNGLPMRKRESPLDLSVKTVKTSADSTARDDFDISGDKQVSSSSLINSRRMLPPNQPGTAYANYDRNSNGRSSVPSLRPSTPQMPVCAPKVDFLPDFNSTPLRHQHPSQPNHSDNQLRRSSSQQLYVPPQHSNVPSNVPLPHMSTFKKSSLPSTPLYEVKTGVTSYQSMNEAARPSMRYPTAEPTRPPGPNDYPSDSNKYYHENRAKYATKRSGEPLYMASGSTPAKHPRMDHWKLAIDKEIQQRLAAAQLIRDQQKRQDNAQSTSMTNGTLTTPSYPQRQENSNQYPFCDKRPYETKVPTVPYPPKSSSSQPPLQPSPVSQAAYPPNYRQGQRSPYTQSVDLPSNTGADKRVLSLLRNSLENKQQREEQMNSQQPILVNHSHQSFQNKVVAPVEPKTNIGRHNLSPFTAASLLERNSNTPPHYKFHVPRAVDSITQETPRSLYGSRVNASASLPAGKEALLGPREENQIHRDKDDSLAAILAAKIRTKAELKQVGTGQGTKPVLITLADQNDLERAASTSTPQSAASSAGSPPKLTREKTPCLPPRRRLFSRSDDDNIPVAATVPAPAAIAPAASVVSARTSGFRSSSETSVFDFRESDSEGEMPVLERQTLEEMRRDRKQLSKVQPPVPLNDAISLGIASSTDLVKIELKENDKITEIDPFWTATCDKFMEQLRNGDIKKRGRRKKIEESEEQSKSGLTDLEIKPENIKREVDEEVSTKDVKETEPLEIVPEIPLKQEVTIKKEEEVEEEEEQEEQEQDEDNNSDDDSDELPLIKRAKKKKKKTEESDDDDDIIPKKRSMRRGSRIKLASTSESSSSSGEESDGSDEFGTTSVADRLRNRKRTTEAEGMKLRSRETLPQKKDGKSPAKSNSVQKPKPKPLFGDGSDFRPGWEEEVYVYKKSLRMPTRLINVSKPSRFHRLSTSLPDLDPGSPALSVSMDSSDLCLPKRVDSDVESICSFSIAGLSSSKIDDEEATSSTTISNPPKTTRQTRSESNSIIDLLARKVGGGKKDLRKKAKAEKTSSKILPKGSNEPELLPTPNLTPLMDEPTKGKTPTKNNKASKPINVTDSFLLGYFRKETVNNFRDTFKNNHALPNEFSTFVLKSRTRTETRVLKKQTTIREVFGEDRPASAPPMQNHSGDTSQDDDSQTETKELLLGRTRTLKQKVVSRLRNVGILRSHKAIANSKRHLLTVQRRKVLLKSLTEKKIEDIKKEEAMADLAEEASFVEGNNEETQGKKKLKLRTGRRKFRSGFDYIRKKKKPLKKDDGVPKERKRPTPTRPNAECVSDIQSEIRTWVIKKGVGETILHRAARLGYTDVTAYCLEKLNSPPSPKDNAGYTPLHEACSRGHLEIAKLLLAYGANPSESANGGIRPLHEAAENGATELVRLLLSYGADPVLATYSGQTPLMLAVDTEAYPIIEQHLDDVQGRTSIPWSFGGPSSIFDPEETGYDPLADPPSSSAPEPELEEIEIEVSESNLPVLFTLTNDPDKWLLLQDLMSAVRVKSRDALLRQINPKAPSGPPTVAHRDVMRELKLPDFLEQSRCCHLLSAGERINVRASKVTLIKYNEKVKSLLNVERVVINLR